MYFKQSKLGRIAVVVFATTAAMVCVAGLANAKERGKVRADFVNTGVDVDAEGRVKGVFKHSKAKFEVKARNLEPQSVYTFLVDGVAEGDFTTNEEGAGKIKYRTRAHDPSRTLDFDPRLRILEISDGIDIILEMDLLNESGELSLSLKEETSLDITAPGSKTRVRARHKIKKDGRERFEVKASRLSEGTYVLYIDGVARTTMTPSGDEGEAKVRFDSAPSPEHDHLLLDFDPRSASVELVLDGVEIAGGPMQAAINDVSECDAVRTKVALATQPDAPMGVAAEAKWRVKSDCRRRFSVELEDMPEGEYDLYVGGEYRGTHVEGEEYELDFRSRPDRDDDDEEDDHLPLTFDPSDALIEVFDGETLIFSDTLATGMPLDTEGECFESEVEIYLFNIDAMSTGKAEAELELDEDCEESFELEIEDMPAGSYDLTIGGVSHGSIVVVSDGEELEGEVEFSTVPEDGEALLDFDPRGQTIVISQEGVDLFSRSFPE